MIYTGFGSEVEIISGVTNGMVTCRYIDDGEVAECGKVYLKADGGLNEIEAAIAKAEQAKPESEV